MRLIVMRTTLELPDPLFARLKARAASEQLTLKQLLRSYVEQGLNAAPARTGTKRSAHTLPCVEGPLAISGDQMSNAALFDLLDA
jgi:predicted DNA-binding ribbon-helix-helix protein